MSPNALSKLTLHPNQNPSTQPAVLNTRVNKLMLKRKIQIDIDNSWERLPSFLKANRYDFWTGDKLPWELDTLHIIRLLHIHNLFLIQRAITRHSRERSTAILPVASEMLGTINDAIVRRERLSRLGLSGLAWKVSFVISE